MQVFKIEANQPKQEMQSKTRLWKSKAIYYCTVLHNIHRAQDIRKVHVLRGSLEGTSRSRTLVLVEHGTRTLDVFLHEQQLLHTCELL